MNRRIAALLGACLGALLWSSGAKAQAPTRLCTPLYNSTTGALSCPEVGQTGPGNLVLNGLPVSAVTVAACGTPPSTPVTGRTFILTIDASGNLCTSNAGGGSIAANVTIISPLAGSGSVKTLDDNSAAVLAAVQGPIPTQAPTVPIGGVGIVDSAGTNVATVKAASTAPAATDKTLVVGLNPGSALPAFAAAPTVKIDQTTPGTTNAVSLAQIGGTTIANGGVAGSQGIGGTVATNVAITDNPVNLGAQGVSSENSAVTTARKVQLVADLAGKLITSPYANRENFIQGAASSTSNSAVTIIASAGGSLKNYITDVECGRSDAGTTAIIVTFNDSASTILVLPNSGGGGGNNKTFNVPLATAAATAFQFTPGTSTTTVYCSAQGYKGY